MKITLNLSAAPSARDRYALSWAVPAILVGLAMLWFLGRASLQEYRDYQSIQRQVSEVQKRADDLRNDEATLRHKLDDPAYQKVLHKAQFVNGLIEDRKFALTDVSARLAGLLPENARLVTLQLTSPKKPGEGYGLRMGIVAKGGDAVDTFINDLEDTPDFKDVAILNQGFQEQASQDTEALVCTAHYVPGVDVDTEKPNAQESAPDRKSRR